MSSENYLTTKAALKAFYINRHNCSLIEPIDLEVGAGTFHPLLFFSGIKGEGKNLVYSQPCRRPKDGRYGNNPLRLGKYEQLQVILAPPQQSLLTIVIDSLQAVGVDLQQHDVKFIEDNWSSPGIASWGLGWECRINNIEVAQITYFQQIGGISCNPVIAEITYGLERLALVLQSNDKKIIAIEDIKYDHNYTYGQMFKEQEYELSKISFDTQYSVLDFLNIQKVIVNLIEKKLFLIAYEKIIKAHHIFNLLDASNIIHNRKDLILSLGKISTTLSKKYLENLNNSV